MKRAVELACSLVLASGPLILGPPGVRAQSSGSQPFFAMCMDTHDARKRNLAEQAQMLRDLGYDGMGHLWLDKIAERLQTADAAGLKVYQVYLNVFLEAGKEPYDPRLKEVVPLLKGRGTQLAVLFKGAKPSDESFDAAAVKILREILELTEPAGVPIVLYPHAKSWLERTEDGIRLARKVRPARVGVMFNLCHWLAVDEEKNLPAVLQRAGPYLWAVTINGADTAAEIHAGTGKWIQPLDSGSFDLRRLLRLLKENGYTGPIGLQAYGITGDAREHLARSIAAWHRLSASAGER